MRFFESIDMKTPSSSSQPKKSLAQQVAQQLQQLIESGRLAVGQKIPTEPELMKQYGVGRSSVREAVRMLMNTGQVSVQQGRGTFVLRRTAADAPLERWLRQARPEEAAEVLALTEGMMARLAANRRTDEQLTRLQQAVEQRGRLAKQRDRKALAQAEQQFYDVLAQATGNALLTELHHALADCCRASSAEKGTSNDGADDAQAMWENLVKQIGEGNAKKAAKVAQNLRVSRG